MTNRIPALVRAAAIALLLGLFASLLLVGACSDSSISGIEDTPRILVSNGYILAGRVQQRYEPIVLEDPDGGRARTELPQPLTLIGEVGAPVNQNGLELRATFVAIEGDRAYVAYNREGSVYAGAVEVIDISDPGNPEVVSQALFDDTDVAALALKPGGNFLAIAGARDVDLSGFESPALLEEMKLDGGDLSDATESYHIPGYVANGLAWTDEFLVVSSGNSGGTGLVGGLVAFSLSPQSYFAPLGWSEFMNAQYVAADEDHIVGLQVGDEAQLHLYGLPDSDLSWIGALSLEAIYPVEGKNTLVLRDGIAFIAMGQAGVQAIAIPGGGEPVHYLPPPEVQPGGLPEDYISNAVALDDDYLYVANGAGGLYVAALNPAGGEAEVYGRWDFGSSANFVATDGELVFVASGAGGLKILQKNASLMNPPLAEWRLDESSWAGTENEVLDERGLNHGRAMGDAKSGATGILCGAGRFDGDGDYVDLGPVDLDLGYALTVCAWVRWYDDPEEGNSWANIVSNNAFDKVDQGQFWIQHDQTNTKYEFAVKTDRGRRYIKSSAAPLEGQWQHVVGVFEGSAIKIYVDGVECGSKNQSGEIVPFEERFELNIGRWANENSHYRAFRGDIDEVMILGEALAAEQILEIYENQRAGLNADGSERHCP